MSLAEKQAEELGRRMARAEMEKDASLADAILGAPLGAIAARIAAPEKDKNKATVNGLLLGALVGFLRGQQSVADALQGKPEKDRLPISPAAASILTGLAVGGSHQVGKLLPSKSKRNA